MNQNPEQAYAELICRTRDAAVLASCGGVLGWDERTYMPRAGAAHRGEQMAVLARLTHEMTTHPRVGELLATLEQSPQVADSESDTAANVREIRRTYDRATKLPKELVEELARVTTQAQQAWQEAKHRSDFATFRPWLEKIISLKRQEAAAVGYEKHPYDALLDEYEPVKSADITTLFADLAAELAPLVAAIAASSQQPDEDLLRRDFPIDRQTMFGEAAAVALGFNFDGGRLDPTEHPFCMTTGPGDCRITTHYDARDFQKSFFSILHETGHALYEQGLDTAHFGTPLGSAISMGIHESQSRMWENQVGRGRAFWEHFFPRARETFPAALRDVSLDQWIFAINGVKPSFIRVEADEATYNLHIVVRFELEQALIAGDLAAADVPGAWNERFRKVLGLTPPDDARGCLQDIHWSFGGLGYFPTYTLGNLYAAQFMKVVQRDLSGLDDDFRRGEFGNLKDWLNTNIHRHGQRYRAGELCRRVTGRPLDHRPFLDYLTMKYKPLYGI